MGTEGIRVIAGKWSEHEGRVRGTRNSYLNSYQKG